MFKSKVMKFINVVLLLLVFGGAVLQVQAAPQGQDDGPVLLSSEFTEVSPYFSVEQQTYSNGAQLEKSVINGPPAPPAEFSDERAASIQPLPSEGVIANFPSYSWVFGCSAVSGAMISGYYDRNGYPKMYQGPTNGGVMPLTDTSWSTWSDGSDTYPNNPLIASHQGVDGRATKGSIDDYWVKYNSTANDPYITGGWSQHTWGTAIGDYMKTSQSAYSNSDGSTTFYNWTSSPDKLTCADMVTHNIHTQDGTYGRKLFYEKRGYNVVECYSQRTDNDTAGGFSLANFKAEIDAGNPVMINVTGHTMVGYGYSGSTIYIRDTWDNNPAHTYTMPWGGSYSGMTLYAVSIVKLKKATTYVPTPIFPLESVATHKPTYKWSKVTNAQAYILQVYEGATKKFAKSFPAAVCGASQCSVTPVWILADGNYKWRVQAKVGGTWRTFSEFTNFNVATEFHYQFTLPSSLDRWNTAYGPWNLKNGWYRSAGLAPYTNSVYHNGLYPTFSYIVMMRRINSEGNANRLFVRGTVYPLDSGKWWDTGYLFQYSNAGTFSVWKTIGGSSTMVKGWTTTTAINPYGWNKLKVKALGSDFRFYINDQLVWSGSDSSITTGKVGAGFYKGNSAWQPLLITYAHLFTYVPSLEEPGEVWAEMGATNTDWDNPDMSPPVP